MAFGEVGLAGEIRPVLGLPRRLAEARRLGFLTAVVPPGDAEPPDGMRLLVAANVAEAIDLARGPRVAGS